MTMLMTVACHFIMFTITAQKISHNLFGLECLTVVKQFVVVIHSFFSYLLYVVYFKWYKGICLPNLPSDCKHA